MKTLAALVFPGFQTLDLFGPLEMFGELHEEIDITIVAETPGPIKGRHGPRLVVDRLLSDGTDYDYIFVPGGPGTPVEEESDATNTWLREASAKAGVVMGVCTGAALLARAGLLDGMRATTCKQDFAWTLPFGSGVDWVRKARWVQHGKFFTSSGVSAGIDMSLAVIEQEFGPRTAERIAREAEYEWHRDPTWDPFAAIYGLEDPDAAVP